MTLAEPFQLRSPRNQSLSRHVLVTRPYSSSNPSSVNPPPPTPTPPKPRPYDSRPLATGSQPSTGNQASSSSSTSPTLNELAPAATPSEVPLSSILWPFGRRADASTRVTSPPTDSDTSLRQPNLARGREATRRVVTEGVLDPRYRPAARRITAVIVALPFALYLTYELFQRRFMGKEQRKFGVKAAEDMVQDRNDRETLEQR